MKKHQLPVELRSRTKSREQHLAAAFLRDVPYRRVEWTCHTKPDVGYVAYTVYVSLYGGEVSAGRRAELDNIRSRLTAWLAEPLSPEVEAQMQAHIDACKRAHFERKRANAERFKQAT